MARKTIYCAQAFWLRAGRLAGGEVHQFLTADRAIDGAQVLVTGSDGAVAFSVEGYPDEDLWEDPCVLVRLGYVPTGDADTSAAA